jgi:hypothetical protein
MSAADRPRSGSSRPRRGGEEGLVTAYVVLTAAALAALLGLALEGGIALNARQAAYVEAEQAARAGASALTATGLRAGRVEIAAAVAMAAAVQYMRVAGHPGTAVVVGDDVIARVSPYEVATPLLGIVGIRSLTVSAEAAATVVPG